MWFHRVRALLADGTMSAKADSQELEKLVF